MEDVESKGAPLDKKSEIDTTEQEPEAYVGIVTDHGLRRDLQERHISLISLASVIGASCFYGFGYALYLSGPLGALIGFGIVGWVVWALMQSIGEVTTMFPIAGGFIEHANRFVDPAFSFSLAWMYYFMWSIFLGSEWNGAVLILQFWVSADKMPLWGWSIVFWAFFSILCTRGVIVYGEVEFYLGWFKIIALFICFFLSLLVNVGAFGNGYIGFRYWTAPTGPIVNGISGFGQVFVLAAAYYVGTEIISLAAGETKDPRAAIPRGVKNVVWRILFVYMGLIFFQGIICPSDSDELLNAASSTASSPFTIAFTKAGWTWSGHFINALIVVAFISAVNGCIYVQSRALYALALTSRAPKVFAITNTQGVPYVSILTSVLWGFLALMNTAVTAGQVFTYMVSVGGSVAYICWAAIVFTHLRVRAGMDKQGIPQETYPFKAYGTIWFYRFNFILCVFLLLINGFTGFEDPFNWQIFVTSYITIPISIIFFVGYKWYHKTRWVRLSEMEFSDRLVKIEPEAEPEKKPSILQRVTGGLRRRRT